MKRWRQRRLRRGPGSLAVSGHVTSSRRPKLFAGIRSPSSKAISDPGAALRLLESGRAVLLSQILETRGDLGGPWQRDAGLAQRLASLRDLIDTPSDRR